LNKVLHVGLIALGTGVGCFLLLMLLSVLRVVFRGPCGPDLAGVLLIPGFLIGGGFGALLTAAALLQKVFHRVQT